MLGSEEMKLTYHSLLAVLAILSGGCATVGTEGRASAEKPEPYCPACHSTAHGGHGFLDSAPVYTGRWEFVSLDGGIKTGDWTHQRLMSVHHMSREPQQYATEKGKTGSLFIWWDRDKHHPCLLREYFAGEEHGYSLSWFPSGQLQCASRIVHERMGSGVWFRPDGSRQAEFIADGEDAVSIDRNDDGSLKTVETLRKWMPTENPNN